MKESDNQNDSDLPIFTGIDISDCEQQTQPAAPIVNKKVESENDKKPKISKRKLYIILISFALFSLIAGLVLWLFVFKGIYIFQGLPLSNFSNSYYSLKIPKGYSKLENSLGSTGTDVTFFDKSENAVVVQSKVYVFSGEMGQDKKTKYFKDLDTQYSETAIEKSRSSAGLNGAAGIVYSKENHDGLSARTISYEVTRKNDHVGRYDKLAIYKSGYIYEIIVSSPRNNPGLAADAKKIFDSFEIK